MRILCKGFNLYNQLNTVDPVVKEFCTTCENDAVIDDFQLSHTFSVAHIKDKLYINCNLNNKVQLDLTELGKIKEISLSDKAILILNISGEIFKISTNDFVIQKLPKFVNGDDVIIHISSNSKLNVAYSKKAFLYSIPERLKFVNQDIVDLQTGRAHAILLDKYGQIYTFGSGSHGQLGTGHLEDHQHPVLVEALAGIRIIKIAAGGWHSAALSQDGDLYIWGLNVSGQLGFAKVEENKQKISVMATPQVVDIHGCEENYVMQVACGSRHTIVLLDNNALYGCGWNKYKQLKDEDQENYSSFVFIRDFSKERVEKIFCGPWNSALICR